MIVLPFTDSAETVFQRKKSGKSVIGLPLFPIILLVNVICCTIRALCN